jgi:hypothetical protein
MQTAPFALKTGLTRTSLTEAEVKCYKEEGYVLLRGLLTSDDAETLRQEVMDIMDKIGLPMTALKQTTEYLEGGAIDALVNHPQLKHMAGQLMEGASTLYMPFTAVKSGGGGGRFHFHQDNQYTRFDGPGLNMWFALNPMTEDNGCLQMIPKSHLRGTLPSMPSDGGHKRVTYDPENFTSVLMQPGDCVAFTRLTIHGSCPNVTPDARVGYAIQFHRDDVKAKREDGEWKLLKEVPRWPTAPVKAITIPKHNKLEGH